VQHTIINLTVLYFYDALLEPKNVKPYSGVITALLVFAGNQFPKCSISKSDSAFWDRWEIITFDKEQHKVDEDFLIKLLTPDNLSGFFNRVIDKLGSSSFSMGKMIFNSRPRWFL
jgi:phage/plasmid-associated DNA primase